MSASTLTTVPDGALHVVAAVIVRDGSVFVTQRPVTSHQGGKWEFPGGKVDPGETALAALRRELHEETGIDVCEAEALAQIHHVYPEKSVFLDVWRVKSWSGSPHGREGQAVRWAPVESLRPSEFPEADRPVLRKLQLPPLYAISCASHFGRAGFLDRLDLALAAGVRLVQVREPQMTAAGLKEFAGDVVTRCRRYGARVTVNGDPAIALDCGADGVHLSSRHLSGMIRRPLDPDRLVGVSCHDAAELAQAARIDADLVVLSPVARTGTHPGAEPMGWVSFQRLVQEAAMPVYALGGMRLSDLGRARDAGAQGVALIRGLWESPDPGAAIMAQPGAV
jgi:8-oxo-dGTP diphosphatase